MYAGVVYWGPHKITFGKDTFVAYNSGDPWDGIAHVVWGGAWVLVLIAVINSTWASLSGEFNAASRVAFALGRVKLLSPQAASIHRKLRTPWIAAIGLAVIAIAVSLIFGFAMSGPKPMGATLFLGALVTLLFTLPRPTRSTRGRGPSCSRVGLGRRDPGCHTRALADRAIDDQLAVERGDAVAEPA
ncbi:MAG: hypothetical protein WBP81_30635 [Solirubrobacteraceae bacterium]